MYIIQELQTVGSTTSVTPAIIKTSRNEADNVFHLALAAAAVSAVNIHAVIMTDEKGNLVNVGYYEHPVPEA